MFEFENPKSYRFYRIEILANNGFSSYTAIGEIAFGYKGFAIVSVGKQTKNNIISYGATTLSDLSMPIFHKNYILQKGVSESSEGLWKNKIERKPLSIRV